MTAIDDWAAELLQNRISQNAQPLESTVATAVAALTLIGGGLIPSGPQAANAFYVGPASGVPAQPTFRGVVTADLPINLALSIANLNLNSAAAAVNGLYLASANTPGATANNTQVFSWNAVSGLSMNTGAFVPLSTAGIKGTTTNDNANAGSVGEFVESVVTVGAPVTITTTAVPQNLTSISLTAGDWDVEGSIFYIPAGGTVTSAGLATVSTVSATLPAVERRSQTAPFNSAGTQFSAPVPRQRFSLSATTTVFLVADAIFTVSTMQACGYINARRVR